MVLTYVRHTGNINKENNNNLISFVKIHVMLADMYVFFM